MQINVQRQFTILHPGSVLEAIEYVRGIEKSLSHVSFIKNLRLEGQLVTADLAVDVPFLGQQLLDFQSRVEPHPDGANLIGLEKSGRAWAMVSGQANVSPAPHGSSIDYMLEISVFIALPSSEKWGGKAFEKMAQATAEKAIERLTLEFPRGIAAGIER